MSRNYKFVYIWLTAACTLTGCYSPKLTVPGKARPMPRAYLNSTDTTNTILQIRETFFADRLLADLIDSALNNNQDLLIALQRIRRSQAGILLNKGAMKPAVRTMAATSLNKYGAYTMDGAGNMTTPIYDGRMVPDNLPDYYIGIQASWEMDIWGKLRSRKRAALARFVASTEGKNLVVTNIISEVAAGYYQLMALDAQLAIIDETITLHQNELEIVRVQKQVGVANELAIQQFESQLTGIKGLKLELLMQIKERENRVNLLLGRYPQPVLRSTIDIANPMLLKITAGIPGALLQNRPDIRQAEAELAAARYDIKAAKAAFYPSLTINAGTGLEAFKTSLLFTMPQSIVYNILGGLAAPLINRSALKAGLHSADAAQMEALLRYRQLLIKAYTEVYTELQRIDNLEQIYELRTQQLTTLTRAIETSSDLFRTGRSTYLEVLITQQNALQSKLERVNTRRKQLEATVNIYKALGGG